MFRGLVTSLRTLTSLLVPGRDADSMPASLYWFPIVGLILGSILYGITLLCSFVIKPAWPEFTAFIAVAASVQLTRGFHLDGLSDWADGFGSIRDKKRILEIMKDSRVGVFGVLALILVMLAKWIAIVRLCENSATLWIIAAYIVSRTIQVYLAVYLPYARSEGGTAAAFVSGASRKHFIISLITASLILFTIYGIYGLVPMLFGLITAIIFGRMCLKRVGGITGDLLGASSEIVETLILIICAAASF